MAERRLNSLEETEKRYRFPLEVLYLFLFLSSTNESLSYWTLFLFFKGLTISLLATLMNEIESKHYILPCKNSKKSCHKRKNLNKSTQN